MTNLHNHVPEPDQQKKNESDQAPIHVDQLPISSSEDDSEDENDPTNMDGYQPLSLSDIGGGIFEFHAEPLDLSHEETNEEHLADSTVPEEAREIAMDADLVLNAMKDVSLQGSSIPAWAKDLSDGEWNDLVKRTIVGERVSHTAASDDASLADSNDN